jgi:hypothetical protein
MSAQNLPFQDPDTASRGDDIETLPEFGSHDGSHG